jgi:hypothetical protein
MGWYGGCSTQHDSAAACAARGTAKSAAQHRTGQSAKRRARTVGF